LHLFFALKSVIYPDKLPLSKQKLSTQFYQLKIIETQAICCQRTADFIDLF